MKYLIVGGSGSFGTRMTKFLLENTEDDIKNDNNENKFNREEQINNEKEVSRKLKEEEDAKRRILTKEEVDQLREGLTKKWQAYNFRYGIITHKKVFDNLVLLRK